MSDGEVTGLHYKTREPLKICWSNGTLKSVTAAKSAPENVWLVPTLTDLQVNGYGAVDFQVPGISAKILTDRLRLLESAQLVTREYARTIPPQVTYSLTVRGEELTPVFNELNAIALRWRAEDERRKAA